MTYDCDVTECRFTAYWELTFPDRTKPWRYCGKHAKPHLEHPDVERARIR